MRRRASNSWAAMQKPLGQQLLGTATRLDVQQSIMSLLDVAMTEGTQSQLNHVTCSPIVSSGFSISMSSSSSIFTST
ncbi:hypothetical protein E2C01_023620 [Portunus trituberculatus]|uniref:Uncharacterized protein n=1 Tax=Portunus trituberculatus TaxID=210409 RepID=A0A5B7EAC2_PORTR|nr:hypothetical protein [Portunus trituberculatus]